MQSTQITKVFYNGRFITLDPRVPTAEAMAVSGDRILAVGGLQEIKGLVNSKIEAIDLENQVVVPGFHDSHMHLLGWGLGMEDVDLTQATSIAELVALGQTLADNPPPQGWIKGRGWSDELFADRRLPTRQDLDRISTQLPVVFTRVCGHILVANSKALEVAGIDASTLDPPGGAIDRDPITHAPTGILRENAMELIYRQIPSPRILDLKRAIRNACRQGAAFGLTTVQSNDLTGAKSLKVQLQAYRELAQAGELPIRVILQAGMPTPEDLQEYIKLRQSSSDFGPYLKLGPLKLYVDGSLGARTAALTAPYADAPDTKGICLYTQDQLDELVLMGAEANLPIATHAIGDGAMDMVLNSYQRAKEEVPGWTARPRIIHCQITSPANLKRMSRLKVVADIQPLFVSTDLHFVEERVGKERAASSYAWKTMQDLGIHTAGGSDCPVESPNPLWGMYAAITRQDLTGYPEKGWRPEEGLSPLAALELFTTGSAYASQEEEIKGSLTPGKLADFVLLPADPTEVPPKELLDMPVIATYVGGNRII